MANSRIMLVCKHCGESCCIGKGYYGSYSTRNDELHKQLNVFYKEHEHGCCSDDTDCSDNARNHFAILEEGEDLDVLTADVVPKSEVDRVYYNLKAVLEERAETRAEFAREIFEEIEEGVKAAISALQFANPTSRKIKHETLLSLMRFIKTIEKKYTEAQDEKG